MGGVDSLICTFERKNFIFWGVVPSRVYRIWRRALIFSPVFTFVICMVVSLIKRSLNWLNLLDYEGKLSITNVAVIALITKMMVSPTLDWPSITAMVVTFANYMHKRQSTDASSANADLDEMKSIKAQYEAAVVAQAKAITDIQSKLSHVSQLTDLMKMTARK